MSGRVPLLGVVLATAVLLLIGTDRAWQAAVSAGPIAGGGAAPAEDDPFARLLSDAKPAESATEKPQPGAASVAEKRAEEPALPGSRRARGRPSRATAAEKKAEEPATECPLRVGKEAIEKALAEPTELEFVETPLSDLVEFLQNKHRIVIQINKRALDDVGIGSDTPITKNLVGITLRSALRLMLQELDLMYVIDNEVLLITTPEDANNRLSTELYEVADLVTCRDEKNELWEDYHLLIEAITTAIHPASWEEAGGPGSIFGGTFGPAKVLVVSQTQEVHEEIAELLAKIRGVAGESGEKPESPRRNRPSADSGRGASSSRAGMGGMSGPVPGRQVNPPRRGSGGMGGAGGVRGGRTAPPAGADPFAEP